MNITEQPDVYGDQLVKLGYPQYEMKLSELGRQVKNTDSATWTSLERYHAITYYSFLWTKRALFELDTGDASNIRLANKWIYQLKENHCSMYWLSVVDDPERVRLLDDFSDKFGIVKKREGLAHGHPTPYPRRVPGTFRQAATGAT